MTTKRTPKGCLVAPKERSGVDALVNICRKCTRDLSKPRIIDHAETIETMFSSMSGISLRTEANLRGYTREAVEDLLVQFMFHFEELFLPYFADMDGDAKNTQYNGSKKYTKDDVDFIFDCIGY